MTALSLINRVSLRAALWLVLGVQVLIAGALVWNDFDRMRFLPGTDREVAPRITDPAAPGDQTRPYRPGTVPAREGRPGGPIALPQQMDAMTFSFQETQEYGRVMLLSGTITPGTSDRFERELDGTPAPDTVALHSPGGSVRDALRIARIVRESGWNTLLSQDAACASACPLIQFAGVERFVSRTAWVGMHQAAFVDGGFLTSAQAAREIQTLQGEILQHVVDMGVDPAVQTHALSTPPEQVYYLLEEEIERYGVATEFID
ncbi:hypothetical protein [Pontivivens insulae]|uniref:ATP-dependent Clp protease proteolytic subunit n=1 Tax=Pontivivens insulae TaxID=1639689 RepID=A0A2R8A8S6_9RHOB|nr:hypothetical protein [Pontivivens insulae]RED18731.1 hypothetical protein DFR53_0930 [Pontivivens insulae]SPF28629.1 hypothetical protein POI8812_00931 [Pontivivens insulae]